MHPSNHEKAFVAQANGVRIGILAADYHKEIYQRLRDGARTAFEKAGGLAGDLLEATVDGVFDLPPVAAQMLEQSDIDALVVMGCVIRGETRHDRFIVDAAFGQFTQLAVAHRKPVALAVLTVECESQARARSGGNKGDAGAFAMNAALRTHAQLVRLRQGLHGASVGVSSAEKKS